MFGRLFEVSGASVVSSGSTIDASLATGPLPDGGGLQDLNLDVTFDDPNDAITQPAHLVGFVQDLPAKLDLRQSGGQTTYTADGTVPYVKLEADNLPGSKVNGALHKVFGQLYGVPKEFTIVHNFLTNGIDAKGPFSKIELDAWDAGDRRGLPAEDGHNKLTLDTRDGRLYVQARILNLQKVLLTSLLSTKVETGFGAPPAPLDVVVDGGTVADPLDVDLNIKDLPISSTFELDTSLGTRLKWNAPTPGTDIHVNLAAKSVGASLDVTDLPGFVDVCVGTGLIGCIPKAPQVVRVDPCITCSVATVVLANDFTLDSKASDTVRIDGRICLPRTDDDGDALPDSDPRTKVYGGCLGDAPWQNTIDITKLRVKDTRLEFSGGYSDTKDEDGDPVEEKLLKLYMDSDVHGLTMERMGISNQDEGDFMKLEVYEHTPLRNAVVGQPFFWLFDMSFPPSDEDDTPFSGQLNCLGTVAYTSLPFLALTGVPLAFLEINPITATGDFCADA